MSRTHLSVGTHKWMSQLQFRPEESGMQVPGYPPILGDLHWRKQTPQCLALKTSRACILESQRAAGD